MADTGKAGEGGAERPVVVALRADDRTLTEQLSEVAEFAVHSGMYDAAQFIYERLAKGNPK